MQKYLRTLRLACYMVFLCLFLVGCGSDRTIVHGLDEREANEIIVFLKNKGIEAQKVKSTEGTGPGATQVTLWDITVAPIKAPEAMSHLNQSGLPRRKGQSLLNIFKESGLVPSELQEKIRYQAGLAEQIATTIRNNIDGVLDTEVQISFPEEDPLTPIEKKKKITASVFVKHSGVLDDPNSQLITKIKRYVASSIAGLDYENVTVIPVRALYTALPVGIQAEGEKDFVRIWTVIVAKESLTTFRSIFLGFSLIILLLVLTLLWSGWKVYPLLQRHGGFKELLHIGPIPIEAKEEEVVEEEKPEEVKEEEEEEPKEPEEL